jgi:hypothetical protein
MGPVLGLCFDYQSDYGGDTILGNCSWASLSNLIVKTLDP